MAENENHRETGARKYPANNGPDPHDAFSQDAAGNRPPPNGIGLTRPANEVENETHHSNEQNSVLHGSPIPVTQETPGVGPAISDPAKGKKAPVRT